MDYVVQIVGPKGPNGRDDREVRVRARSVIGALAKGRAELSKGERLWGCLTVAKDQQ